MPGPSSMDSRLRTDDGSADPRAAAALAAFAAGAGSEHAALTALARLRLLVPVVAAPAPDSGQPGTGPAETASEMSIPTLVGRDSRLAVAAFTCLAAMTRWQPAARPVPVDAGRVWRSAVADSRAVMIDVAGPVPVAIDGARLAALASGKPVPLPHEDPDVLAAVRHATAGQPAISVTRLLPAAGGSDLTVELAITAGPPEAAAELARGAAAAIMARLGGRLRRGIQVAVRPPPG